MSFLSMIYFREAVENNNLLEVIKLLWKNVHGVIVMKNYLDGKQFPLTKNGSKVARNTKEKVLPNRLQKGRS